MKIKKLKKDFELPDAYKKIDELVKAINALSPESEEKYTLEEGREIVKKIQAKLEQKSLQDHRPSEKCDWRTCGKTHNHPQVSQQEKCHDYSNMTAKQAQEHKSRYHSQQEKPLKFTPVHGTRYDDPCQHTQEKPSCENCGCKILNIGQSQKLCYSCFSVGFHTDCTPQPDMETFERINPSIFPQSSESECEGGKCMPGAPGRTCKKHLEEASHPTNTEEWEKEWKTCVKANFDGMNGQAYGTSDLETKVYITGLIFFKEAITRLTKEAREQTIGWFYDKGWEDLEAIYYNYPRKKFIKEALKLLDSLK